MARQSSKKIDGKKVGLEDLYFFLDGAHTSESITECLSWFDEQTHMESSLNVLCFNCKSSKQYEVLINSLVNFSRKKLFHHVIFVASKLRHTTDQSNMAVLPDSTKKHSEQELYKNCWQNLEKELHSPTAEVTICEYIEDCMEYLTRIHTSSKSAKPNTVINVLVTGSLYLVGGFLQNIQRICAN